MKKLHCFALLVSALCANAQVDQNTLDELKAASLQNRYLTNTT